MILIIDNYDSFTYNLYQGIAEFYSEIKVVRNDQITVEEIESLGVKGIILSPGPGRPEEAGICVEVVRKIGGKIPILGVCLGHQAIGICFGGKVIGAPEIRHGKESFIFHDRQGVFEGMHLPFIAGRYHSLIVEKKTLPPSLKITAESEEGIIMAFEHEKFPIFGVQFHPESILTPEGKHILKNFLRLCLC